MNDGIDVDFQNGYFRMKRRYTKKGVIISNLKA